MYEKAIRISGKGRQDEGYDLFDTPGKLPSPPPLDKLTISLCINTLVKSYLDLTKVLGLISPQGCAITG